MTTPAAVAAATTPTIVGAAAGVRCDNVVHIYAGNGRELTALRGVDLTVAAGETVAVLGPSGSGKTTLLWLIAGLLRPTAGHVEVGGRRIAELTARQATALRLRQVGILLQDPGRNLLPYETALGNILFAQRPTRRTRRAKHRRALELLAAVGLDGTRDRLAGRLSGGEQQRLAVAVALANGPAILLADEPTSQLDADSAAAVIDLLLAANRDLGTTILVVTHDPAVSQALQRTVTIRDGRIGSEGHEGTEYILVGRDGTLALPPEFAEMLPPGSLAEAIPTPSGVELRPYPAAEPPGPDGAPR